MNVGLDGIASLARTALTDPAGLTEPHFSAVYRPRPAAEVLPSPSGHATTFAVEMLDAIINVLNPSEWTPGYAVTAIRTLGTHLAETEKALTLLGEEHTPGCLEAAQLLEEALARLDVALVVLQVPVA